MWSFFSETRVRQLSVFWGSVIIMGLFVTRWLLVLPSIGIAGFFVTSVAYAVSQRRVAQWTHRYVWLSFTVVYGLHLASGLWHSSLNDKELQRDLVLQLPFLLLPLSFLLLPAWGDRHKRVLWEVLMGCCLVSALAAAGNYLQHATAINTLYNESQVMPTEPDHVRFSLLIAIAVLAGGVILLQEKIPRLEKWAILAALLLLFLFQHLLAVRSGLLSMYVAGLVVVGWNYQRWKLMLSVAVLAISIGYASLMLLPTMRIRVANTLYDTRQASRASAANDFSVTARLYSYEIAQSLIRQHPWLGIGKVELPVAMARQYGYRYPEINAEKYVLPHNQFIYNAAAYGGLGLLVFLTCFYYPFWAAIRQRKLLAIGVYCIVTISFLTEYTLETNIGVLVGLFFPLLSLAPEIDGDNMPVNIA